GPPCSGCTLAPLLRTVAPRFAEIRPMSQNRSRSSKRRYRKFVEDYKAKRLDALLEREERPTAATRDGDGAGPAGQDTAAEKAARKVRRRKYLRESLQWLKPYRGAVVAFIVLALARAGLEMIEPLFMRFMVDKVLLNKALDAVERFSRLNLT